MKKDDIQYIFQMGEFFERVQMEKVFPDSKTFVDCTPKKQLTFINDHYKAEKDKVDFNLKDFVHRYFDEPSTSHSEFKTQKEISIKEHINKLWDVLTRKTEDSNNSLIPLPKPYVVPGGRFRELFYWDSYFTMLGLEVDNRYDLIENMIENFAYLINKFGYIPNGNRTYFLSRSQPPFFAVMLELLAEKKGKSIWAKYLPAMEKEYAFWMKGKEQLSYKLNSIQRVALMEDGSVLNHYWDESSSPRPEAYRKEMEWSKDIQDKNNFFRHERAACESGWDFSSRWFLDGKNISTNRCADLIPVDLNCILYFLEKNIAENISDEESGKEYSDLAEKRKNAIEKYCWNEEDQFYFDYDFKRKEVSPEWTIAAAFPLFFNISTENQADAVAKALKEKFLNPGGFLTTLKETGQQWDAPNGWAPLEWMAIKGLMNYGHKTLAKEAARKWMKSNESIFEQNGKLMEKYNVEAKAGTAVAGTYPTQDGFGWTNGVYLACSQII